MEWSVYLDRPARKFYERHVKYRLILDRIITMLKEDPYRAIYKKPKGKCRGFYVARVGEVRVLYKIYVRERIVRVRAVGLRENFYEKYC